MGFTILLTTLNPNMEDLKGPQRLLLERRDTDVQYGLEMLVVARARGLSSSKLFRVYGLGFRVQPE